MTYLIILSNRYFLFQKNPSLPFVNIMTKAFLNIVPFFAPETNSRIKFQFGFMSAAMYQSQPDITTFKEVHKNLHRVIENILKV